MPSALAAYGYSLRNPLRFIDPDGEAPVDAQALVLRSVFNAGGNGGGFRPVRYGPSSQFGSGPRWEQRGGGSTGAGGGRGSLWRPPNIQRVGPYRSIYRGPSIGAEPSRASETPGANLPPPAQRRLVIGGGRAEDYPRHPASTVTLDKEAAARPDIRGIGQSLPIGNGQFGEVQVERLPFDQLTGARGRDFFRESHRVLIPGGRISGITGAHVPVDQLRSALKEAGFDQISIGAKRSQDPVEFSATKPGP